MPVDNKLSARNKATTQHKIDPLSPARRRLIQGLGAGIVLGHGSGIVRAAPGFLAERGTTSSTLFTLGVASGDPTSNSVVIWTRLAPDPLNGGGMTTSPVNVTWQVANDQNFKDILASGQVTALADNGHAVHAQATGLPADSWMYYRFIAAGEVSRTGRTRTFPALGAAVDRMRCALASCQNYPQGYFTAYEDMLNQELDFVIHVGDYIYESGIDPSPLEQTRNHPDVVAQTLDDYRNRYALYRLDADLADAHASLPFLVTWDDHEVANNYTGSDPGIATRRRNAYKAYAEHMPLAPGNRILQADGSMTIYRRLQFGSMANLYMLDTRQYRTGQAAEDGLGTVDSAALELETTVLQILHDPAGITNPQATIFGNLQENQLAQALTSSNAQWNVIAQSVMMMTYSLNEVISTQYAYWSEVPARIRHAIVEKINSISEGIYNMDSWDGYPAARSRLMGTLEAVRPNGPVVLSGDFHSAWAGHLLADNNNQNSDLLAAEFLCSSISANFGTTDPRPTHFAMNSALVDNEHVAYFNGLYRGYCICDVDANRFQTTYRAAAGNQYNPDPFALAVRENSTFVTDRILEVNHGFNAPNSGERITEVA